MLDGVADGQGTGWAQMNLPRTPLVQVKICGLQPQDDLSFTENPLVHHVGFVFVKASKRYVEPTAVRGAIRALPADTQAVGVFADEPVANILRAVDASGISVAQLHGNEAPAVCQTLKNSGVSVWKAISVPLSDGGLDTVLSQIDLYKDCVDAVLLDAKPPVGANVTGGHGQTFDWTILHRLAAALDGRDWWVAGGLRPDNIAFLLKLCRPTGIDVSSGVERNGRKDVRLINAFLHCVQQTVQLY
ncbi:phosphoribosylanthranilate isomerase [Alicyclobacillus acidoterrestris]|uniref:phosphoribosylanthranilate isomerase n=1 Tax=Alicyclobacillus TaxID=29330 RepID=UPI001F267588|nr:phosphoribosylanthranilate isomerase [Alicyclobacillus suci]